jgi:hypothetical protein
MVLYCARVADYNPAATTWIGPIFTKRFISGLLRAKDAKLSSVLTRSRRLPLILILEAYDIRAVSRVFCAVSELGNVRVEVDRLY